MIEKDQNSWPPNSEITIKDLLKKLCIQLLNWTLEATQKILPLITETIIFGIFILGERLIIGWMSPMFAEISTQYPFLNGLYDTIKIASLILIVINYLGNCIIVVNREKETFSKVLPKRFNLFHIKTNKILEKQSDTLASQTIEITLPILNKEDDGTDEK
jgi:hypothetical protein